MFTTRSGRSALRLPQLPAFAQACGLRQLALTALVAAWLATPDTFAATGPAAKPNVIVLITDDQGYGDLSCHGNPVLKTPNLDRLHAESVRLTDFHVAPMCTPTRGQLMTGRDALANGAMNVSSGRTLLRRDVPTMPEKFAAGGYRTGIFGKWHLGDNYPYRPHDRGFHEALYYPSSHIGSAPDHWTNDYADDVYLRNGRRKEHRGYTTDVFFREAMEWMKSQAETGKPFFCYLPTAAPHGPLHVPKHYTEPYRAHPPRLAQFYGMIANIDENVGRLDAFLREQKLHENTVLIYLTDNGTTMGDMVFPAGMRGKKIGLYEGGHRVPFFVRWPAGKLRAPGDVAGLTQVQDVLPTLIELCGLPQPPPSKFDGMSLAPLLRGETNELPDRTLVVQFSRMNAPVPKRGDATVMWQRWRLVNDQELYDLRSDGAQKTNVIAQHPEVAEKMRAHYATWWQRVEPRMNEFSAIVLGADAENPVQLSPADWADAFLDQAAQVRAGVRRNGPWHVEVERAGDYEIELRRWPREADMPIASGLPKQPHAFGEFTVGVALPIAKARLKVGDFDQARDVSAGDKSVIFKMALPRGRTQLQTWFSGADGRDIAGAYYVYVTRK